jgi:hypothetical protein
MVCPAPAPRNFKPRQAPLTVPRPLTQLLPNHLTFRGAKQLRQRVDDDQPYRHLAAMLQRSGWLPYIALKSSFHPSAQGVSTFLPAGSAAHQFTTSLKRRTKTHKDTDNFLAVTV